MYKVNITIAKNMERFIISVPRVYNINIHSVSSYMVFIRWYWLLGKNKNVLIFIKLNLLWQISTTWIFKATVVYNVRQTKKVDVVFFGYFPSSKHWEYKDERDVVFEEFRAASKWQVLHQMEFSSLLSRFRGSEWLLCKYAELYDVASGPYKFDCW